MKLKVLALATVILGLMSSDNIAEADVRSHKYCLIEYSPETVDSHTGSIFRGLRQSNNASFETMKRAMQKSIDEASGLMVEGKRVLTLQESTNADQIVKGIANNARIEMNIRHAIDTQDKIQKIIKDHSPMSVGLNPCQVVDDVQKVERTKKATKKVAEQMSQQITARSGHYANRNEAMARQLALHELHYCTADQVSSGLCKQVGDRTGKSLMASTLFKNAKQGDKDDQDKTAFINNMVGLPDEPIPQGKANTSLAIDYQDKKRQNDSLKSIAIYALSYLQAQSTEVETSAIGEHNHNHHDHKADRHNHEHDSDHFASYSGIVHKDIERHFGGSKAYIQRKKYLAGATEKGVMMEIIKADSLLLRELADLYEAQKISLALTAGQTLALMKYVGMDTKVEQARQKAVRQQISSIVMADNLDGFNVTRKEQAEQAQNQGKTNP